MELTFFIVGLAVLLTARSRRLVGYAAGAAVLAAGTGAVVANYAGANISTSGFAAFNFAEPTVLAQGWNGLSVAKSTAVAVALLALWVVLALVLRQVAGTAFERWRVSLLVPVAAMNLPRSTRCRRTSRRRARRRSERIRWASSRHRPQTRRNRRRGQRLRADWEAWIPQSFEVWSTALDFFYAAARPAGRGEGRRGALAVRPARPGQLGQAPGLARRGQDRLYGWVAGPPAPP